MPPKLPKKFEGEGNPSEIVVDLPLEETPRYVAGVVESTIQMQRISAGKADWAIEMSEEERLVLKKLLDRDRTAKIVHGGLRTLLSFTDDEADTLLNFLRRI